MGKVLLPYRHEPASNWYAARCKSCGKLVAYVTDEALHSYPKLSTVGILRPVLHRCPCTCSSDPHNCPIGQALVAAIHERKGNQ